MGLTLQDLDDKQLYDELHKAGLAEKLANDPAWGLFKEASDRIVERAVAEFALKTDLTDVEKVMRLQMTIRMYRFGFLRELEMLKEESNSIYREAQERGIIGRVADWFKQ
jgi:hypothetical protein